jgi:hypothetical protein
VTRTGAIRFTPTHDVDRRRCPYRPRRAADAQA